MASDKFKPVANRKTTNVKAKTGPSKGTARQRAQRAAAAAGGSLVTVMSNEPIPD